MANPTKKTLSKNLLKMKFMQRASQSLDVEENDGCLIEKWVAPNVPEVPKTSGRRVVEYSFVECEDLNTLGRFSFNKFNKEVERLSKLHSRTDSSAHHRSDEEDEGTIPALEVARRYEDITSRKLLGKRQRADTDREKGNKHRPLQHLDKDGFMKPV